jgi:hypothetical protein
MVLNWGLLLVHLQPLAQARPHGGLLERLTLRALAASLLLPAPLVLPALGAWVVPMAQAALLMRQA